jgi:hypothetical protein
MNSGILVRLQLANFRSPPEPKPLRDNAGNTFRKFPPGDQQISYSQETSAHERLSSRKHQYGKLIFAQYLVHQGKLKCLLMQKRAEDENPLRASAQSEVQIVLGRGISIAFSIDTHALI